MECCLQEVFSVLNVAATAMGAGCVVVIVVENSASIRVIYQWPDSGLEGQGGILPHVGPIEDFLKLRVAPAADSFLVVPWPEECARVVIGFGFTSAESDGAAIPNESSAILRLAALAIWTSVEAYRLRRDLTVVSERLGQRKTVERAKGLLQAQHGWTEPQAYEHLRKLSRQRRKPMAEIAQTVLRAPQPSG